MRSDRNLICCSETKIYYTTDASVLKSNEEPRHISGSSGSNSLESCCVRLFCFDSFICIPLHVARKAMAAAAAVFVFTSPAKMPFGQGLLCGHARNCRPSRWGSWYRWAGYSGQYYRILPGKTL